MEHLMRLDRKYHKQQGFTLIELLIVMAILGMLAALVAPTLIDRIGGTQREIAATQIANIETAVDTYRLDMFKYPNSLEDLVQNTSNSQKWQGPYLKNGVIPKDPWGNDYQYRKPGQNNRPYDLYSFAADGQQGGEGDNADVNSWE
jgi:general secretion pathway protein G